MNNINYNTLFEYLSLVGQGSWSQFKNCINNANYSDIKLCNDSIRMMFSRLGHIEFNFSKESGNSWSITPPFINLIPNSQTGILSGSRTKTFLGSLREYCGKNKIDYILEENFEAPNCIKLNFKNENAIETFKNENDLNIQISNNLPYKILYLFENIENTIKNLRPLEDFNNHEDYELKMFNNTKKYGFDDVPTGKNCQNGFYERNLYGNGEYYLRLNKNWYSVEKNIGKFIYFYLNNVKNLIKYETKSLKIIKYLHFPELIDRALTNCSGYNSKIIEGYRTYENIDLNFAINITAKLGQELGK